MIRTLLLFALLSCLSFCNAQQIVLLEEGTEISLLLSKQPKRKVGEKVEFKVKYDVYTEDNLVVASDSEVKGIVVSTNKADEILVEVAYVYDLHGNKIQVRCAKQGNSYLIVKANGPKQSEYSIYVDKEFWFSY